MTPLQQQRYYAQHLRFHQAEERAAVRVVLARLGMLQTNIEHVIRGQGLTGLLSMIDLIVTADFHAGMLHTIYQTVGLKAAGREHDRLMPHKPAVRTVRQYMLSALAKMSDPDYLTKDRDKPKPIAPANRSQLNPKAGNWQARLSAMMGSSDTVQRVKDMTARTSDLIRNVVTAAISAGTDIAVTVSKLRDVVVDRSRALLIARTEVTRAASVGAEAGAESTGLKLYKKWLPLLDVKTRYDHANMYDKPAILTTELFDVGGRKMRYPGDPAGGAAQCCNCRCICLYLPPDNSNDN